jgi:thioredoxin 1
MKHEEHFDEDALFYGYYRHDLSFGPAGVKLTEDVFAAAADVPVKGMVTMVDLGAGECIPCKMMAPILIKLEKSYAGKRQ